MQVFVGAIVARIPVTTVLWLTFTNRSVWVATACVSAVLDQVSTSVPRVHLDKSSTQILKPLLHRLQLNVLLGNVFCAALMTKLTLLFAVIAVNMVRSCHIPAYTFYSI